MAALSFNGVPLASVVRVGPGYRVEYEAFSFVSGGRVGGRVKGGDLELRGLNKTENRVSFNHTPLREGVVTQDPPEWFEGTLTVAPDKATVEGHTRAPCTDQARGSHAFTLVMTVAEGHQLPVARSDGAATIR
jgi:hypothetical protein